MLSLLRSSEFGDSMRFIVVCAASIAATELLIRLPWARAMEQANTWRKKSFRLLASAAISDFRKEQMIPYYSFRMAGSCVILGSMILTLCLIVVSVLALGNLLLGEPLSSLRPYMSQSSCFISVAVSLLFYWIRARFVFK